jgi:hypothetical protein
MNSTCHWRQDLSPWVGYKDFYQPGIVAHAFNPSTREAEACGILSSRPAWSTEWVPGQPGLHRETLSQKTKKKKKKKDFYLEWWAAPPEPAHNATLQWFPSENLFPFLTSKGIENKDERCQFTKQALSRKKINSNEHRLTSGFDLLWRDYVSRNMKMLVFLFSISTMPDILLQGNTLLMLKHETQS